MTKTICYFCKVNEAADTVASKDICTSCQNKLSHVQILAKLPSDASRVRMIELAIQAYNEFEDDTNELQLTREVIISANQEGLNELIAIHLFGWFRKDGKLWSSARKDWTDEELSRWTGSTPDPFSSEISAAYDVIKAMRRLKFDYALESFHDSLNTGGDKHHARFMNRQEGHYGEYDSQISEADAICRAALLALLDQG